MVEHALVGSDYISSGPITRFTEPCNDQIQSPLLRLPAEIREMILRFVVVPRNDIQLEMHSVDMRHGDLDSTRPCLTPRRPNILYTCQLLFHEARATWVLHNSFTLHRRPLTRLGRVRVLMGPAADKITRLAAYFTLVRNGRHPKIINFRISKRPRGEEGFEIRDLVDTLKPVCLCAVERAVQTWQGSVFAFFETYLSHQQDEWTLSAARCSCEKPRVEPWASMIEGILAASLAADAKTRSQGERRRSKV